MTDEFTVNQWGTPPDTTTGRKSKYVARMEVVKQRNLQEPEVWGVVARFGNEAAARSRASLLRKEYNNFEAIAVDAADPDAPDDWVVWARWGQANKKKKEKLHG